jgi:Uma2 family endonuclease
MSNIAADIKMPYGKAEIRKPLLPLTLEEREEMGAILSVPATVEEYIDYLHKCDYKLQYSRGMIWSFIESDEETKIIMGEAAPIHEQLTNRFARLIGNLLDEGNSNFKSFGSNIKVYIPKDKGSIYYNPDLAITRNEPQFIEHKPKKKKATSLTNPTLIVEILSKSTEGFDKTFKLGDYQKINSVEQIIFIEPNFTWVSTYIRQSNNSWLNIIFENLTDELPVLEHGKIVVNDIYKNLIHIDFKTLNKA